MAHSLKIDEGVFALTEKQCQSTVLSKVVHFRSLPKECSDEELIHLCSPFGQVVNHMCHVGPKKNQGFVEFVDINKALAMVSFYASSSYPAQIQGKIIYVQHSDRDEIVVNKFTRGKTLLVTMEGVQARDLSIDVIHLVFSAFGFVLKISTFEKRAGFKPAMPQPTENHVLWATFENMQYDVTMDVLYEVFSEFGIVQKISILEKNSRTHALIQYLDVTIATAAKNALEGHYIYDGGYCKLHLSYSRHTNVIVKAFNDKSRDYTRANHNVSVVQVPATTSHNPHDASVYPDNSFALQAQVHGGQIPSWNPTHGHMFAPSTFPDQAYSVPPYLGQSNPVDQNEDYMEITPPEVLGSSPPGVQPYYYGY
ncbi:Polypyrimidine tract-binding protein-like 1 [Spatholobus suberectus]|nr:Polypyrimidine tract-binding protein-like 1 [Spatholobus suberectus]